jgi:hypothetical protein
VKPSIGRLVHYTLSQADADQINRRRQDFHQSRSADEHTGYVGHVGNWAAEGDVYPALIVRVWEEAQVTVNAQVFLDGNDVFWTTSRPKGNTPGTWAWPERV